MTHLARALSCLGFESPHLVAGRMSVADLFRDRTHRCGIYALTFSDETMYVGQAVDVVRRFSQHRKTHDDIAWLQFKPSKRQSLDDLERATIQELERLRVRLRNIVLVSMPPADSDFDLIMDPLTQERWLRGLDDHDSGADRVEHPDLRARYRQRYLRFRSNPFADEMITILGTYGQTAIPAIRAGEIAFWACSCLPAFPNPMVTIHTRISLNWQEVFTICSGRELTPVYSFHAARSVLEESFGASLRRLRRRYHSLNAYDHRYDPGGQDQVAFDVADAADVVALLADAGVVRAIREFNLRLCRKGPCAYGRYHCLDLADHLVGDGTTSARNQTA